MKAIKYIFQCPGNNGNEIIQASHILEKLTILHTHNITHYARPPQIDSVPRICDLISKCPGCGWPCSPF